MKLRALKPRLRTQHASSKNRRDLSRGSRPWHRFKAKIHLKY